MISFPRKLEYVLRYFRRRSVINTNGNQIEVTQPEMMLSRVRSAVHQDPSHPSSKLLLELSSLISSLQSDQAELRRQAFREAVRGLANALRNRQIPPDSSLAKMLPGAYATAERLADEIERTSAAQPVTITELRQLRQKLKTASEGGDEIDEVVKRIYYATLLERNPSTEDIIPPGSPSRSLDIAAFVVEKVFPNGWWTLGSNGVNIDESAVAKVGSWTGDNPKAELASTAALALLGALVLTLIESQKKESR